MNKAFNRIKNFIRISYKSHLLFTWPEYISIVNQEVVNDFDKMDFENSVWRYTHFFISGDDFVTFVFIKNGLQITHSPHINTTRLFGSSAGKEDVLEPFQTSSFFSFILVSLKIKLIINGLEKWKLIDLEGELTFCV